MFHDNATFYSLSRTDLPLFFSHSFLKNGIVSVDSINAMAGTTAFNHGRVISIAHIYTPIEIYVNMANKIRLIQLVSHALSTSTRSFRSSIFCIFCSKFSILFPATLLIPQHASHKLGIAGLRVVMHHDNAYISCHFRRGRGRYGLFFRSLGRLVFEAPVLPCA